MNYNLRNTELYIILLERNRIIVKEKRKTRMIVFVVNR